MPLISMEPLSIVSSPFNVRTNVDFPDPDGPQMTTCSPLLIFNEILSSAVKAPKTREIPFILTIEF